MARPIDADALIDNMVDYVADGYADSRIDFESYTKMVQTAPTIDAVSVVHGEWIPHPTEEEWDVCTACGTGCKRREIGYDTYFERTYVTEYGYPFCPNCGAKMDGERREP